MSVSRVDSTKNSPAVSALQGQQNAQKTQGKKDSSKAGASKASGGVSVELSPEARQASADAIKAKEIATNTPDVREERIAEIKNQIKSGTYKVGAEQILDGMFAEAERDELSTALHRETRLTR